MDPATKGVDIIDEAYDQVYAQIENLVRHGSLDLGNVDDLIKSAMEVVEFLSTNINMTGTQKAEIAKGVIVRVIDDLKKKKKIEKELADGIIQGINLIGPVVFKLIIMADKGKFSFLHPKNKKGKKGGCCW